MVLLTFSSAFVQIFFQLQLLLANCASIPRKPAVVMMVGVNGGGKTTSLGKTIALREKGSNLHEYIISSIDKK